jgi:hypothetical protein
MRYLWIAVFCFIYFRGTSQVTYVPYFGVNSTKVNDTEFEYTTGGNFAVFGAEVEAGRKKDATKRLQASLVTGVSFLRNGHSQSSNLAITSIFYSSKYSELKTSYWRVPITLRLNWTPSPLVEDWKLFFDAGITVLRLNHASLSEKVTISNLGSGAPPPPPQTTSWDDNRDITHFGKTYSVYSTFELGMKFRRVQLIYRLGKSLKDTYFKGIEGHWNVPADKSPYLYQHANYGVRKEKLIEIILGYRINAH